MVEVPAWASTGLANISRDEAMKVDLGLLEEKRAVMDHRGRMTSSSSHRELAFHQQNEHRRLPEQDRSIRIRITRKAIVPWTQE